MLQKFKPRRETEAAEDKELKAVLVAIGIAKKKIELAMKKMDRFDKHQLFDAASTLAWCLRDAGIIK